MLILKYRNKFKTVFWFYSINLIAFPLQVVSQELPIEAVKDGANIVQNSKGQIQINIVNSNSQGLSHNQYIKFNVDTNGVTLNNEVAKAHTILNEVTGTTPSQLNGTIGVSGPSADVILANPNGISCNGCGFSNTHHGILTTGRPLIDNGVLTGFDVQKGLIEVKERGALVYRSPEIDSASIALIASRIKVNGKIRAHKTQTDTAANEIHLIAGEQKVRLKRDAAKRLTAFPVEDIRSGKTPDEVAEQTIDVGALGGMHANQIYLVDNSAGVGVNSNAVIVPTEALVIDASSKITLAADIVSGGDIDIKNSRTVTNHNQLKAKGNLIVSNVGSFVNGSRPAADHVLFNGHGRRHSGAKIIADSIDVSSRTFENYGTIRAENKLNLDIAGDLTNISSQLYGGDITLKADNLIHKNHIVKGNPSQDNSHDTAGTTALIQARSGLTIDTKKNLEIGGSEIQSLLGSVRVNVGGKTTIQSQVLNRFSKQSMGFNTVEKGSTLENVFSNIFLWEPAQVFKTATVTTSTVKQTPVLARLSAAENFSLNTNGGVHIEGAIVSADKVLFESKNDNIDIHPMHLIDVNHEHLVVEEDRPLSSKKTDSILTNVAGHAVNTKFLFGSKLDLLATKGDIQFGDTDFISLTPPPPKPGFMESNSQRDPGALSSINIVGQSVLTSREQDVSRQDIHRDVLFYGITAEGHSSLNQAVKNATAHLQVHGGKEAYVRATLLRGAQTLGDLTNLYFADTVGGSFGVAFENTHSDTHKEMISNGVSQMYADKIAITSTRGKIQLTGVDMRSQAKSGEIALTSASHITLAEADQLGKTTFDSKTHKVDLSALGSANAAMKTAGVGVRVGYGQENRHKEADQHSYAPFSVVAAKLRFKTGWPRNNGPWFPRRSTHQPGDMNLLGGKVVGHEVSLDVIGDLNIKSLQDSQHSYTSQNNWGGSLGVDVNTLTELAPNGGINGGYGNKWNNATIVAEQAGILAHTFHGTIGQNVDLVGAHIVATGSIPSLLTAKAINAQILTDTHDKNGYYIGGGVGLNVNGLPMANLEVRAEDYFQYRSIQKATLAGLQINVPDSNRHGEINSDAKNLMQIMRQDSNGAVDITATFAYTPKGKQLEDTHPVKRALKQFQEKVDAHINSNRQKLTQIHQTTNQFKGEHEQFHQAVLETKSQIEQWKTQKQQYQNTHSLNETNRHALSNTLKTIENLLASRQASRDAKLDLLSQAKVKYEAAIAAAREHSKHDATLEKTIEAMHRDYQALVEKAHASIKAFDDTKANFEEMKIVFEAESLSQSTGRSVGQLITRSLSEKGKGLVHWEHPYTHDRLTTAYVNVDENGGKRLATFKLMSQQTYREVDPVTGRNKSSSLIQSDENGFSVVSLKGGAPNKGKGAGKNDAQGDGAQSNSAQGGGAQGGPPGAAFLEKIENLVYMITASSKVQKTRNTLTKQDIENGFRENTWIFEEGETTADVVWNIIRKERSATFDYELGHAAKHHPDQKGTSGARGSSWQAPYDQTKLLMEDRIKRYEKGLKNHPGTTFYYSERVGSRIDFAGGKERRDYFFEEKDNGFIIQVMYDADNNSFSYHGYPSDNIPDGQMQMAQNLSGRGVVLDPDPR